jgi:hypothetical protein
MTKQTAPDEVAQAVADEVRVEMARQRKTASDLADVLGITPHTAGRRLNGAVAFNVIEVYQAADWLGIEVTDLFARAIAKKAVA